MLHINDLSFRIEGRPILAGATCAIPTGHKVGLIGPNGAGKTTLFNCLSRLYIPNDGDIQFEGKSILSAPRHAIPKIGMPDAEEDR